MLLQITVIFAAETSTWQSKVWFLATQAPWISLRTIKRKTVDSFWMLEKSAARLSPADGCWMSTPQPRPAQLPAICQTTPYPTDTPTPSRNINPRCIHHQKRWYLFPELRDLSPGRTNILRLNLVCFSPCVFYPFSYPHFFFSLFVFVFRTRHAVCRLSLFRGVFVNFFSWWLLFFLGSCANRCLRNQLEGGNCK